MRYRKLGRTGISISEVGFGAWGIGKSMWKGADDTESLRALEKAVDEGVNFFDTALVYGNGHSERLVGEVVRNRPDPLYVATKVPPRNYCWPAQGPLQEAFPRDHIVKSVDRSLKNLGLDQIDLLQLHVWNPDWISDEEWHQAFVDLRQSGKVAFVGVSLNDHEPGSALELVRSGRIDTVQVIYNIFDQSPEDQLFPTCTEHGVGVIARVPFDEGSLTGKVTAETVFPKGDWRNLYFAGNRKQLIQERIQKLAALLGQEVQTLPELALKFCLHSDAVSTVIPGMRSVAHVVANASASDGTRLTSRLMEELRRHRWVRNYYPPV